MECHFSLRGIPSFYSDKYDISAHPNFKYLADYDEKNTFILKDYFKREKKKEHERTHIRFKGEDRYIIVKG